MRKEILKPEELQSLIDRAHAKARALSDIIQSSAAIQSTLDRGAILEKVIEESTRLMRADVGSLMVLDPVKNELVYEVATGESGRTIEKFRLPVGTGIAGWVALHGEALNIKDAYEDPRFFPDYDKKTGYRTRSVLCVPLKVQGRVIGIAQVINKMPEGSVFDQDDLEVFSDFANMAAVAVETSRMHTEAIDNARQRERISQELAVAKEVQASFLPDAFPQIQGVRFYGASVPAREVGGDLYDVFELSEGRIAVVLGDVSGKGVSAALYMAKVSSDLRLLAESGHDPSELLFHLNNRLASRAQRGMFCTLVYMEMDLALRSVTIGNAGQLPPLVRRGTGGATELLMLETSPPLGIMSDLLFPTTKHEYLPGSCYVFYTDGVSEARNRARELYGLDRLQNWFARANEGTGDPVKSLFSDVDAFVAGADAADDMTAVVVMLEDSLQDQPSKFVRPLETTKISMPSSPGYLSVVRAAVLKFAEAMGFTEKDARQLSLAVDEGCTNVIKHCYGQDSSKVLEVNLARYGDKLEIEIKDYGAPMDPAKIKSRDLADVRPGGLGVHLIKSICDEAEWRPGFPRGNTLRMVKRVHIERPTEAGGADESDGVVE